MSIDECAGIRYDGDAGTVFALAQKEEVMKKLLTALAMVLALTLCGCTAPTPAAPAEQAPAKEQPEQPAVVHVTTFTAQILSNGASLLAVPTDDSAEFGDAGTVTIELADGLVPVGADGWPISVSELAAGQSVDVTYLGSVRSGDPASVLAVAIRVVPEEDVVDPEPTAPVIQPETPTEEEPVYEPFETMELQTQAAVPAEIPYDGVTHYGFPCVRTEIIASSEVELDGCGTAETVQLLRIWDQYEQQSFVLRIQKGESVFDTGMVEQIEYPPSFNAHVWLADLDADTYPEIYFCGDMASDDYVLNVWSMKSGEPTLIPIDGEVWIEAAIIGISDGSLQLESTQNVLGSYTALRAYALHDGELQPLGDAWQIVPANTSYSRLSVVKELPVTLDDGTESSFPQGTVLQVTGTDGKSFADVITQDGVTGRVMVERRDGDWQWYINGESELEYFELVPYAG